MRPHAPRRTRRASPAGHAWRAASRIARVAYVLSTAIAVLLVGVSLRVYASYYALESSLHGVQVGGLTHRSVYGVQNILVLGSQTRDGQGRGFGRDPGTNLSDNLILIHLDPTHTHATVLSIPRDTMVYEPACKARKGVGTGTWPAFQMAIIDGAMNLGGPTCAVHTVEDLTGIKIDHFIEFNFNSFRAMVDALGGVEVCVPPGGYSDPYSHLHLRGGLSLLTYNQALAYVRTRHGVGNGGDLGRIQLQQAFISSVIQKVTKEGLLSNASKLYKIVQLAVQALTVDQGLDTIGKLASLAGTMTHLRTKNVTFLTMPNGLWPVNINRLVPTQPAADVVFGMLLDGHLWHHHLPQLPPSQVQVQVLNGSGIGGLAGRTARKLRALGFDVVKVGNAPTGVSATTVQYSGISQADDAFTLMAHLAGSPQGQNLIVPPTPPIGTPGPITLVLGTDFAGVAPLHPHPGTSSPPSTATVQSRNAADNICSGLPAANRNPGTPP